MPAEFDPAVSSGDAGKTKKPARRRLLAAVVGMASLSAMVLGAFAGTASAFDPLPAGQLEQYRDGTGVWTTGSLGSSNSAYSEAEAIPFRIEIPASVAAGSYEIRVCRDFQDGTTFGYLFLEPFNTDRSPTGVPAITDTLDAFTGAAATGTVDILTVNETGVQGTCVAGARETIVEVALSGTGVKYVLFGGHLAGAGDQVPGAPPGTFVTPGNSAAFYSGASLSMRLSTMNRSINPSAIVQLGQITVQKVVDSGTATPDQFCFNIAPNPTNVALPLCPAANTDTVVFPGLPSGPYTVTEVAPAGYAFASGSGTNCTFDGSTATATVTAAVDPVNANCVFHNARLTGDLTITKDVVGAPDQDFLVDITCSDASFDDTGLTINEATPIVIEDIPTGTTCSVAEQADANFETTYTPDPADVTIIEAGANVAITNTRRVGTLVINKVTIGAPTTTVFSVDVDCNDGVANDRSNAPISQTGAPGSIVISDIPLGTDCFVTEDPAAGFSTEISGGSPNTIDEDNVVTITNTRLVGDLTINKVTVGAPADTVFTVDVNCSVDSFDLTDEPISQTANIVIEDIPTGTSCSVTEDPAADFSTEIVGSPAVIIEAGNTVTITNTFEEPECPEEEEGLRGAFNRGGDDCPEEEDDDYDEEADEDDAEEDALDDDPLEDAGDPVEVGGKTDTNTDQPVISPQTEVQNPPAAPADPALSPAGEEAPIPLQQLPRTGSSVNLMKQAMLALLLVIIGVPAMIFGRRRRSAQA